MCFFYPKNIPAASAAEVTSDNVVGYSKVDLVKGYTQVGVQFQNVGSDGVIGLNDMTFTGLKGFDWNAFTPNDYVTFWDPTTQTYSATYYWSETDDFGFVGKENVWIDEANNYAPADITLTLGKTLFIHTTSVAEFKAAGEVSNQPSIEIEISKGYTQISNPYPVELTLNDITFTGLKGFDWNAFTPNDIVTIWDPTTQTYSTTYYWSETDDFGFVGKENAWIDEANNYAPASEKIPVGGAIFIKTANGGTATFTK